MAKDRRNPAFPRMISAYCRLRGADLLPPRDVERLCSYTVGLFQRATLPPRRGKGFDWRTIAANAGVDHALMLSAAAAFRSGFEALEREVKKAPRPTDDRLGKAPPRSIEKSPLKKPQARRSGSMDRDPTPRAAPTPGAVFHEELDRAMCSRGETSATLQRALRADGHNLDVSTIRMWRRGVKTPLYKESREVLRWLEARYGLAPGHFRAGLPNSSTSTKGQVVYGVGAAERRRLAWHLPDDFHLRAVVEQEEIVEWVQRVVVSGATDYRRYQAAAMKHRFALQFPALKASVHGLEFEPSTPPQGKSVRYTPPRLVEEMAQLLRYKTATLAPRGYMRRGVWARETAEQKLEHFGLFFGALSASPDGPVRGLGANRETLTLALLAFPQVWDWYLHWRQERRGFFTAWKPTCWQSPQP